MSDDPKFVAERLVWRFKKSGAEGVASKPYAYFPDQVRDAVRLDAGLLENEVPAVLCYLSGTKWALLTTERLVWRADGAHVMAVDLSRIKDATVEAGSLLSAGSKRLMNALTIVETDGTRHQIELEPGMPFSGFWNAVKAASGGDS